MRRTRWGRKGWRKPRERFRFSQRGEKLHRFAHRELQHVGHAETWHAVALEGDEDSFTARYFDREGGLLAALAANRAAEVTSLRRELAA